MPLISVCIPTYNGAKYLQVVLDSVKAQTYKNIEVIISDDDSQDQTLDIYREFQSEVDFPVYIYYHDPNYLKLKSIPNQEFLVNSKLQNFY
ncbi:MAG: glycosyltransferase [Weeksellaceae bacterium]|nr:glycosyltransferase [Weeksellaceae bacterium]